MEMDILDAMLQNSSSGTTIEAAVSGYVSVGVLGGMAFEPYYSSDNTLLSELNHITAQEPVVVAEICPAWVLDCDWTRLENQQYIGHHRSHRC